MQCKYVRQATCMSFAFHPNTISLFSLVHFKNRLRIIQQNLYTGLIMNDFPIPLRQETLEVDNYTLCYNDKLDLIVFTLSNHILIYSLEKKVLLVVAEAQVKNTPYYIHRTVTKGSNLFFAATEQKMIFAINLQQSIKTAGINNYIKYKISSNEAEVDQIAVTDKIVVALCSDRVLRIWEVQSTNALKGVALENVGRPTCFHFSKNDTYLLIGTSEGYVQAWDGESLGVKNTKIMSQKITNIKIQSICWFHYAGESHSLRFLVFTQDGHAKLYSFWFERNQQSYVGKCSDLSLLYINRHQVLENYIIRAHPFANFIFFSPGVLLYMVDSHPLIYYPVILKQPSASFQQLVPNHKKQIYYTRDILFMKGLEIKRIKDTIQDKLSLQNDLQYKQLKILRLDIRPWSINFAPLTTKLMVVYYLNSCTRVLTLSNLNLNERNDNLTAYKEYSGNWIMFIGPKQYYQPYILIVQEDKQTITVLAENVANKHDLQLATEEEKRYFDLGPGEIYTKKINIKIQKVYPTPFRYHYVVLYQSDNLLRFSNNINYDAELINYDVFTGLSLRLDYTDIILDVVWTHGGEMGAVICLDKVVFINADLKVMKSAIVSGYVVQGQWIGYTLLITTKKDVQYLDILSKPQQAYCLQSLQSKYLIMRVMADRIFGAEKDIQGNINVKARYFKIMQPLISGYLNYQQIAEIPVDHQKIKSIIECFAPYFIVSEEFIQLLNNRGLSSVSKYFLQGNQKMYSKPLRAKTLNDIVKIQRFIPEQIWRKNKKILLDLYLSYEQSKDSNDPYEVEKGKQYAQKIKSIVGSISFDSIKDLTSTQVNKGVTINNNFGEQSLYQLYHDFNKDGQPVKMQIYPFKAENCGEWLGQYGLYIESKPYFDDQSTNTNTNASSLPRTSSIGMNMVSQEHQQQHEEEDENDQNQFKNLIVYYRCDEGKGTFIEDLSDYGNNGTINDEQNWIALEDQPMQTEDKWGKKVPPQFSLTTQIIVGKKLNTRSLSKFTAQIWIKPIKQDFSIVKIGKQIQIRCKKLHPEVEIDGKAIKLSQVASSQVSIKLRQWVHLAIVFQPKQSIINAYLNSVLTFQNKSANYKLPKIPISSQIGDPNKFVQYTELRLWRKALTEDEIKQHIRTPLELVAQKRKKLKMKLKEKKKKTSQQSNGINPFSLDF